MTRRVVGQDAGCRTRARVLAAVVAMLGSALVASPAVAQHEVNGLDPVVTTPEVWRGWIAVSHRQEYQTATSITANYDFAHWAVNESGNSPAPFHAGSYSFMDQTDRPQYVGDPCHYKSQELAGELYGSGLSDIVPETNFPSRGLPFPADAEGLLATLRDTFAEIPMSGIAEHCQDEPSTVTGTTQVDADSANGMLWGTVADLSALPGLISSRTSWERGQSPIDTLTVQFCMSRSSVDADGDGLPDDVDLAPGAAAPLSQLGTPGGPPLTLVGSRLANGPSHREGVPLCPTGPVPAEGSSIVALGDSFSSGEGAYSYAGQTDIEGTNHCHVSAESYPFVAFKALQSSATPFTRVKSFACSGAKIAELTASPLDDPATPFCGSGCSSQRLPAQVNELAEYVRENPAHPVDVVTVGIGGNDAGFSTVIEKCAIGPGNCVAALDESVGGTAPGASIDQIANSKLPALLAEIRSVAPRAKIVVLGYPVFISAELGNCPGRIGADEAEWMRGQIQAMNLALEESSNTHGATFLSLERAYGNEVLCSSTDPDAVKVNGFVVDAGCIAAVSYPGWAVGSGLTEVGVCNESFHPNARGHAAAGDALALCLRTGDCGTSGPVTSRPAGLLDKSTTQELVGIGTGVGVAWPALQPFQAIARGFRPGSIVQFELHSDPLVLGTAVADGDGVARLDAEIPAEAAPGPHEVVAHGPGTSTILNIVRTAVSVTCSSASTAPECATPPTLSISPAVISAGQVATVTYKGRPGAVIEVLSRTQPATSFSRIATLTLDSNGLATSTHKPQKNTRMAARSAAGTVSTSQPLIQVRSVASFNALRVGTRTYVFTGRVYPALSNRLVNIYRNGGLVAQARSDATGIYRVTRTLGAGTFYFQARTPNDTYNLGATSPLRQVRIY